MPYQQDEFSSELKFESSCYANLLMNKGTFANFWWPTNLNGNNEHGSFKLRNIRNIRMGKEQMSMQKMKFIKSETETDYELFSLLSTTLSEISSHLLKCGPCWNYDCHLVITLYNIAWQKCLNFQLHQIITEPLTSRMVENALKLHAPRTGDRKYWKRHVTLIASMLKMTDKAM